MYPFQPAHPLLIPLPLPHPLITSTRLTWFIPSCPSRLLSCLPELRNPFHPLFMSSWFKSCDNSNYFNMKNNDQFRSQFCTCQDSLAVVACAKLWPDWIIKIMIKAIRIVTRFQLSAHKLLMWKCSQTSISLTIAMPYRICRQLVLPCLPKKSSFGVVSVTKNTVKKTATFRENFIVTVLCSLLMMKILLL